MPTTTTTYSFNKPVVGSDEDAWGGYLNGNWDAVDDLLDGTTPVTGIDINSGAIDGTPIGAASASTGNFSTLSIGGTAITATATELNYVDGVTSNVQTQIDAKAAIDNPTFTTGITAPQVDITAQGDLRLQDSTGGEYVALQAPATIGTSYTLTMPSADGAANQVLQTDGSGTLSFADAGGGGTVEAVASGALASGDAVLINSDGTVSVVEQIGTSVSANTGSVTNWSGDALLTSAVYDEASQKVVIAFKNGAVSNRGYAIVGTVSGSSITFGTEVIFSSNTTDNINACYANGKIVIAYEQAGNNNYVTCIVGEVSGTSITFGTAVVLDGGSATVSANQATCVIYDQNADAVVAVWQAKASPYQIYAQVGTISGTSISFGTKVTIHSGGAGGSISGTYDPDSQNIVITYRGSNPYYGQAIVGTVSGTSLTLGSETAINSSSTRYTRTVYDTANQKVVIAYTDLGNSNYGTAVVGTVSGTSITFGTPVVFESAALNTPETGVGLSYHAAAEQVIIGYSDGGNSNRATLVEGTVSGTSITFETPVTFYTGSTVDFSSAYDTSEEKVIITWRHESIEDGQCVVFNPDYTSYEQNLTSSNFIGFSKSNYSDGETAKINVVSSVDDNQTGLTAGQRYYVQVDGSLSTTADDPSVEAGIAISSTKILVKG